MNKAQFNDVTVLKEANVHFDGKCISHTVLFADGKKKMLGVILPSPEGLKFKTHMSERMEIVTGECEVCLEDEETFITYRAGQSFLVSGHTAFVIKTKDTVNYICHLEG